MFILLIIPLITALLCYFLKNRKTVEYVNILGAGSLAVFSISPIFESLSGRIYFANHIFFMDALSGYILAIVILISFFTAIYSVDYIGNEFEAGLIKIKELRYYYSLLHLFIFTIIAAVISNNLAVFWIAIEGTTLVSALLVGFYKNRQSIEAAWKYIILCTVSITFALLGIFITYYASVSVTGENGTMNWTELQSIAHSLNPSTMNLAFIFILVGYGAKAGLAPVHNWLPDAHSQAPTPISALLSGVLLKCAFLGIIRFVIILNASSGPAYTSQLLLIFGLLSMGIATAFILLQNNYKRLLAYHSIEHIGIISTGFGIGGYLGIYGALLHILNHAIVKVLLFFTTGQARLFYHTTKIEKVKGMMVSLPISGTVMLLGALAIAGAPPFNIFISEFTILKAAVDSNRWLTFSLFIFFATIIFGGVLHHFSSMAFGKTNIKSNCKEKKMSSLIILIMAAIMLILGFYIPSFLDEILKSSAKIIMGE